MCHLNLGSVCHILAQGSKMADRNVCWRVGMSILPSSTWACTMRQCIRPALWSAAAFSDFQAEVETPRHGWAGSQTALGLCSWSGAQALASNKHVAATRFSATQADALQPGDGPWCSQVQTTSPEDWHWWALAWHSQSVREVFHCKDAWDQRMLAEWVVGDNRGARPTAFLFRVVCPWRLAMLAGSPARKIRGCRCSTVAWCMQIYAMVMCQAPGVSSFINVVGVWKLGYHHRGGCWEGTWSWEDWQLRDRAARACQAAPCRTVCEAKATFVVPQAVSGAAICGAYHATCPKQMARVNIAARWRPAMQCSKTCSLDCKVFFTNGHSTLHLLVRFLFEVGAMLTAIAPGKVAPCAPLKGHLEWNFGTLPWVTVVSNVGNDPAIKKCLQRGYGYGRHACDASQPCSRRARQSAHSHPDTSVLRRGLAFELSEDPPRPHPRAARWVATPAHSSRLQYHRAAGIGMPRGLDISKALPCRCVTWHQRW